MAQAAVKAAPREKYALLRAGWELATHASLQLLAQAEAWNRTRQGSVFRWSWRASRGLNVPHLQRQCCYSTCGSHFADERCRSENPPRFGHLRPLSGRTLRNGSSSERCPGTLANEGRCREEKQIGLDRLPQSLRPIVPSISPSKLCEDPTLWQCYICAHADSVSLSPFVPCRRSLRSRLTAGVTIMGEKSFLERSCATPLTAAWPERRPRADLYRELSV